MGPLSAPLRLISVGFCGPDRHNAVLKFRNEPSVIPFFFRCLKGGRILPPKPRRSSSLEKKRQLIQQNVPFVAWGWLWFLTHSSIFCTIHGNVVVYRWDRLTKRAQSAASDVVNFLFWQNSPFLFILWSVEARALVVTIVLVNWKIHLERSKKDHETRRRHARNHHHHHHPKTMKNGCADG